MSETQLQRPATAEEVRSIVGPVDETVLARIVETGATPAEVLEAFTWTAADDRLGEELQRLPTGRVAQVYEILTEDDDEESP
jgi:hypothetical protein